MSTKRPWLCAESRDAEEWTWGGATKEEAIGVGLECFLEGFWIAPAHRSDPENIDDSEHDFTIEPAKAEWIPNDEHE